MLAILKSYKSITIYTPKCIWVMVKNMGDEIGYYNGRMFDREDLEIIQQILEMRQHEFSNYKVANILSLIERYLDTGM